MEAEVKQTLAEFPGVALLVSHDRGEVYRMSSRVCVLNEGTSEPLAETVELFAHPRTLQSALITGCKNCAPAELLPQGRVFAPEWNALLACESAKVNGVTHIGIRAHDIAPCAEKAENALLCRVVHAEDDVFSRVLTLLPAGGTASIRAELDKTTSAALTIGSEAWFTLPKRAVMPLCDELSIAPAPRG